MTTSGNGSGNGSRALVGLSRSLELVGQMLRLAEEGKASSRDDGCRLLYDTVGQSAHRIQACVVAEMLAHQHEPSQRESRREEEAGNADSTATMQL